MERLQLARIRKGEQIGEYRYLKDRIFYLLLQEDEVHRIGLNKKLDSDGSEPTR